MHFLGGAEGEGSGEASTKSGRSQGPFGASGRFENFTVLVLGAGFSTGSLSVNHGRAVSGAGFLLEAPSKTHGRTASGNAR